MWDVTGIAVNNQGFVLFLLTHPVWDVTDFHRVKCIYIGRFLLTHPVWDVTYHWQIQVHRCNISTHTSRVGCDVNNYIISHLAKISTHTSRVGCDTVNDVRRPTIIISTHTSRVGCDLWL